MKNDDESHIIRLTKSMAIDTKNVKKYLKKGFKFAFSQIGLAGLVVGYVILGALIFMKIIAGNLYHVGQHVYVAGMGHGRKCQVPRE